MTPTGLHLAEFNFGTLKYDWDDPRVADFANGLDLVNGLAKASPGFVWMLGEDEMEAEQTDPEGALGGNPRMASTLSVWETAAALEHFVWNTLHRSFYGRKAEWYDADGNGNLVLWWVPAGDRPTAAEGMARWQHMKDHGNSDHAFGWSHLKDTQAWTSKACSKDGGAAA